MMIKNKLPDQLNELNNLQEQSTTNTTESNGS